MDKNHHFLYRITNKVNSHYYIGIHSTDNLNDGYMGSGALLKEAIKEFGIENFTREIIDSFDTRKQALAVEAETVNLQLLSDPKCYNLIVGGNIGMQTVSSKRALFNKRNKAIYSKDATELVISTEKRWDPEHRYTFHPVEAEVEKWRASCDYWLNNYKHTSFGQFQYDLTLMCVDAWPGILDAVTKTFNSKATNKKAEKLLGLIKAKNLESCYTVNRENW